MAEFFLRNIVGVYFFYGLSFFCMGLAVTLEITHSSNFEFARSLQPLAGFGLVHGSHEWFEMFLLIAPTTASLPQYGWITPLRMTLLATSFIFLIAFGARLIDGVGKAKYKLAMFATVIGLWLLGLLWVILSQTPGTERSTAIDVYTRYALAIPGSVLTVWGLLLQRRRFIQAGMPSVGADVALAAISFGLYGLIGQLFTSASTIFPSSFINAEAFIRWFGFPIQVFRALMACCIAAFIIRSLRAFEMENRNRIEELRKAQIAEREHLEETRAELLHRTVKAQEAERKRIARELHDETGQTLTALGMGLRGLSETIGTNPDRAIQQAKHLEFLASSGIEDLQRLVSGLHPPQLDDLGLGATLRWYASEVTKNYSTKVIVNVWGSDKELPIEVSVVCFRIAQEAITNAIRHSSATQISIYQESRPKSVILRVEDNGQGFKVEPFLDRKTENPGWGLLGMIERATLIGGTCKISSLMGMGTRVEVFAAWE